MISLVIVAPHIDLMMPKTCYGLSAHTTHLAPNPSLAPSVKSMLVGARKTLLLGDGPGTLALAVSVSIFRERGSDAVRHSMQSREHADSILYLPIAEETDFSFRHIHHK